MRELSQLELETLREMRNANGDRKRAAEKLQVKPKTLDGRLTRIINECGVRWYSAKMLQEEKQR